MLLMAIRMASQMSLDLMAAVKMYSLPKNPAVMGNPSSESRNTLSAAAAKGWRVPRPAKSSVLM